MKTIALGDTHGRSFWKLIVHTQQPDRVVFIGDYFDSRDGISAEEQIKNFLEIVAYKKQHPDKVVLLIGNHDLSYFPGIDGAAVSGYQHKHAADITKALVENIDHLQMAYDDGSILYSHAGVGKQWLETNGWDGKEPIAGFVNKVWENNFLAFEFFGLDPYGDSTTQTPVWIRPGALVKTWKKDENKPTQVFGHTTVERIDFENYKKWGNMKFIPIDALGSSGEYLIITDGELSVGKI